MAYPDTAVTFKVTVQFEIKDGMLGAIAPFYNELNATINQLPVKEPACF